MNVHLTFDVEVWCRGWNRLDQNFPVCYERYVYGRSEQGDYALPKTLEILERHGLRGVFFVEPLFSARFGRQHLRTIVDLIAPAGHDIQLHLHPEWAKEIHPPPIADVAHRRPYLNQYSLDEQVALIGLGRELLEAETGRPVSAFRAGSYGVNADTYAALARNGIGIDSSLNELFERSGPALRSGRAFATKAQIDAVAVYPITVFTDGLGRPRPAQVGACSFGELRSSLLAAAAGGCRDFVIVSHNFEMLKPGTPLPDPIIVRRFEKLCEFLAQRPDLFVVGPFQPAQAPDSPVSAELRPSAGLGVTATRYAEQFARRVEQRIRRYL